VTHSGKLVKKTAAQRGERHSWVNWVGRAFGGSTNRCHLFVKVTAELFDADC